MYCMSPWPLPHKSYSLSAKQEVTSLCPLPLPYLGPSHHDGLPADLRSVPDQIEEAHRQDDSQRAALRRRVPLRQLSPHHQ